ncbi:MAG: hypothetical protein ACI8XV_001207 [Arenicella sp.]|jgi:hypothetical protein
MMSNSKCAVKPQCGRGFVGTRCESTLTMRSVIFLVLLLISSTSQSQVGVYQTLDSFLAENFNQTPSNETLWLNDEIRTELSSVLNRNYRGLRIRYWRDHERTAWILNEIGKERPITSGIVVERGKIVAISVLEYRESRGGEVQLASFRRQFIDASLNNKGKLDHRIDGVTGATMSVRTLNRSAIAALKLHSMALNKAEIQ